MRRAFPLFSFTIGKAASGSSVDNRKRIYLEGQKDEICVTLVCRCVCVCVEGLPGLGEINTKDERRYNTT